MNEPSTFYSSLPVMETFSIHVAETVAGRVILNVNRTIELASASASWRVNENAGSPANAKLHLLKLAPTEVLQVSTGAVVGTLLDSNEAADRIGSTDAANVLHFFKGIRGKILNPGDRIAYQWTNNDATNGLLPTAGTNDLAGLVITLFGYMKDAERP